MKHGQYFAACFFFARFILFYTSEALNINYNFGLETQLEQPEIRHKLPGEVNKECPHFQLYSKFINLVNNKEIIDDIINSKHEELIVLFADDIKDAITLAQFLSQNNRILPKKKREEVDDIEKSLYDLILQNYHLYKNVNTSTVFFAYPRNINNAIFGRYIAKKVMHNIEKIKVVLTLAQPYPNLDAENSFEEKEDRVNGIFKVMKGLERYKNTTGFVIMNGKCTGNYSDDEDYINRDKKQQLDYTKLIDNYLTSSNASDSEKLLGIYLNHGTLKVFFSSGFTTKNYEKLITYINDFMSYADGSNFNHMSLSESNFSISDDEFDKLISFTSKKDLKKTLCSLNSVQNNREIMYNF